MTARQTLRYTAGFFYRGPKDLKVLVMIGLVGLYLRQVNSAGRFGVVAFLVALGWLLFGIATFQARVLPRPAALLLIAGLNRSGGTPVKVQGIYDRDRSVPAGRSQLLSDTPSLHVLLDDCQGSFIDFLPTRY